jgi:hypothetical protein
MRDWSLFQWLVLGLFLYLLWLALRPKKRTTPAAVRTTATAIAPSAGSDGQTASLPAIWNPFAAANWSLLFTPIFGAILLSMNWTALGESSRAKRALVWAFATPLVVIALVLLGSAGGRGVAGLLQAALYFSYVAVWYFASARPQGSYVKSKYQEFYPRKPWTIPIIVGLVLLTVFRNLDRYLS